MKRRDFIGNLAVIGAGLASVPSAQSFGFSLAGPKKPDILLIMPDQMRGDCLSILNHSAISTPNMDELARQGVLFERAYATVPSCIAARYALLSGLYPQTSGVVGYTDVGMKKLSSPTLPSLLAGAGYSTVLVGRNMHQTVASGTCGYQKNILGSTYVDNDEYDQFLRAQAPASGGILNLIKTLGVTLNYWQAKPWPLADTLHPTEWVVSRSRDVVAGENPDQPLFLTTSFYAPHPPLFPPQTYFDSYMAKTLPQPAHGAWVDWASLPTNGVSPFDRILLQGEMLRRAQSGYFGQIQHEDTQIAALISEFKARSEKAGRPWVIIFTSDHGEMLGDHGYFRKCEPYQGSANIPLIISGSPELGFSSGLRVKQPVCLEDIMPTLLALAGAASPTRYDGVNLVPVLRGGTQHIRDWLHFEHATTYSTAQAFHALTDGKYKYIWRPLDGQEQLFDLDADPREECDLSQQAGSAEVLAQWRQTLVQRLAGRPEGFSQNGQLIAGRPYPAVNAGYSGIPQAGTVFFEDFEDDTIGARPAIGGMNIGNPYGAFNNNTEYVQANPEAGGDANAQVLRGGGAASDIGQVRTQFAGGGQLIDGLTVSFDFYSSWSADVSSGVNFCLMGVPAGGSALIKNRSIGGVINIDGHTQSQVNFGSNVWQHFTGTYTAINSETRTYQLVWSLTSLKTSASIGGTNSLAAFSTNFLGGVASGVFFEIQDVSDTADYYGYIDNIQVTTPTPATIGSIIR